MQVGIDVKCMQTNFGGHGLFGFGDIATFKNGKFPFPNMVIKKWFSPAPILKAFHFQGILQTALTSDRHFIRHAH